MTTPYTHTGTKTLKLKCNDTELERLVCEVVSRTNGFAYLKEVKSLIIDKLEEKDFFEKEANVEYKSIELTTSDLFRINKILCKMLTNGQLIINFIKPDLYNGDGIELAWAGE
ncbi:MAG: hypothetical protein PHX62_08030 [Bacilli bacterium]|nr:hypothetical protein [Bacilli bacterium]